MPIEISDAAVVIVSVSIDARADLSPALDLLDDEERARAARFVRDADRRRFVVSHSAVRRLLASVLGARPRDLRFEAGRHGKPRLSAPARDVRFSLSHSGDHALVALAIGRDVGVDIECWRPIEILPLARRFFAATECARIEPLDPPARPAAFFRVWTRKESFVKATGRGLSFPLRDFDVDPDGRGDDPVVLRADGEHAPGALWTIRSLDAPDGCSAALAVEGDCEPLVSLAFETSTA